MGPTHLPAFRTPLDLIRLSDVDADTHLKLHTLAFSFRIRLTSEVVSASSIE
jgi:hypothetical protein